MTNTYTVKQGDTLLQVAIDNQVEFIELLALNPKLQPNPDLIHPGEVVVLPEDCKIEKTKATHPVEPPEKKRPTSQTGSICSEPACKESEYVDILFVLDKDHNPKDYYCLDEESQKYLLDEVEQTDKLIALLKELQNEAPSTETATEEELAQHTLKREAWLNDAIYAGAVKPKAENATKSNSLSKSENAQLAETKRQEIEKRIQFVSEYTSIFHREESLKTLQKKVLESLNKELAHWESLTKKAEVSSTSKGATKKSVNLDKFNNGKSSKLTSDVKRHIREVLLVSQNKAIYIRDEFFVREKPYWKKNSYHKALKSVLDAANPGKLKQAIKDDLSHGVLKNKEISKKLSKSIDLWTPDGWHWKVWQATGKVKTDSGHTLFAVSGSAQLFRWGAKASVDSTLEVKDGVKADIGIGANASFALAEASVKANCYVPYEKGFGLTLSYLDANKNPALYSFGRFRFNAGIELGAFVGVTVDGKAGAEGGNNREQPSGTEVLLSPRANIGPCKNHGGQIGISGEGFAGAQVGGKLTGGIEWLDPKDEPALKFGVLASLGGEGNLAFGAGAGVDFQFALIGTQFYLHCAARVVWGLGAQGGFAVCVDVGKIWDLVLVIWKGLQYVDYRTLQSVNELAYEYLTKASYLAFASDFIDSPTNALENSVVSGVQKVSDAWDTRSELHREADFLARRILDTNSDIWSGVSKDYLFPETIGMMLNTLVEGFYLSFDEKQESAICFLLKETTYSWRKFEEILARMNETGTKENSVKSLFKNMDRLNAILDGTQQRQFNKWVYELSQKNKSSLVLVNDGIPFKPAQGNVFRDKREQIQKQINKITV
ncbi:LysM peptidoglycan-binding domain-containing protein [Vibrio salinus]|uniref:LysM peptidoglycan-binding domain-containing protein n=1 Tax=Vibrio salinus TaxID=2899784 RepID=UPI001E358957|nr:LysM domain-containing protein [Vibrio salinus]MCE0495089.1 LysM peptidoglycan-binding domain-containing protein [Vibrio salinus]